jgi:hypothetical protein
MQDEVYVRIPLGGRYRDKPSIASTIVDPVDAYLAEYRWSLNHAGYALRNVQRDDGTYYAVRMHRLILGLERGDPRQADHISGDRLDNRRANLRIVTNAQNAQNMASHRDARSPYRGVHWFKPHGKWCAKVCINGKRFHVGYFDDELEAAEAARDFRLTHMTYNVEERH